MLATTNLTTLYSSLDIQKRQRNASRTENTLNENAHGSVAGRGEIGIDVRELIMRAQTWRANRLILCRQSADLLLLFWFYLRFSDFFKQIFIIPLWISKQIRKVAQGMQGASLCLRFFEIWKLQKYLQWILVSYFCMQCIIPAVINLATAEQEG